MSSTTLLNWVLGEGPSKIPMPPSIRIAEKSLTALNILVSRDQSRSRLHREGQWSEASTVFGSVLL